MATYVVTTSNWNSPAFWSGLTPFNGDTLDLSALPSTYSFTFFREMNRLIFSDGTTSFSVGPSGDTGADAQLGSGEVHFFDVIVGTEGADTIVHGSENQSIYAGGGNDRIEAGGGADEVHGGAGNDYLDSGGGTDTLYGGAGLDVIAVSDDHGIDEIYGGDDYDQLVFATPTSSQGVTMTWSGDGAGSYDFDGTAGQGTFA